MEIVPATTPYGLMAYFVVLGLVVMLGIPVILLKLPNSAAKAVAALCMVGVGLVLVLISVIVGVGFAGARARGPILVISLSKKEVSLPREHKTWPLDQIVRWEIVHGWWVRGEYGKPYLFPDEIAELQMVVRDDSGKESAWPIVGGSGPQGRDLVAATTMIATRMGLPMAFIESRGPMWPVPPRS